MAQSLGIELDASQPVLLRGVTGSAPGATISGRNLSIWRETYIDLKFRPLGVPVAVLGWDDRVQPGKASYAIDLGEVLFDHVQT